MRFENSHRLRFVPLPRDWYQKRQANRIRDQARSDQQRGCKQDHRAVSQQIRRHHVLHHLVFDLHSQCIGLALRQPGTEESGQNDQQDRRRPMSPTGDHQQQYQVRHRNEDKQQ